MVDNFANGCDDNLIIFQEIQLFNVTFVNISAHDSVYKVKGSQVPPTSTLSRLAPTGLTLRTTRSRPGWAAHVDPHLANDFTSPVVDRATIHWCVSETRV